MNKEDTNFLKRICKQNFDKLTEEEKKLLIYSQDLGFWFDEISDNLEVLKKYNNILIKIGRADLLVSEAE